MFKMKKINKKEINRVEYFSKEYKKVLNGLFKQGHKKVDITVFDNGLVITSPRREIEEDEKR